LEKFDLEHSALIVILAATDAVFIPDRDPLARPRHTVIWERRQAAGVPWASDKVLPGLDESERKRVQRALDELAARGWVATIEPNASKTLAVRLTHLGDAHARALVGLPQVEASLPVVEQIRTLMAGDEVCDAGGKVWVPETALAGVRWGDNEHRQAFVEVEERILPALTRRWVESNCSIHGHCWYTLGPVEPASPPAVANLPARSDMARAEYYHRVELELDALARSRPDYEREIGDIPMPVAGVRRARA